MSADNRTHDDAEQHNHESLADRRDALVADIKDHARALADAFTDLYGDDATVTLHTDDAEWTLQLDDGSVRYLKYEDDNAGEVYVISEYEPPEPAELHAALQDFPELIDAAEDLLDQSETQLSSAEDRVADAEDRVETAGVDERAAEIAEHRDGIVADLEALCEDLADAYASAADSQYGTLKVSNSAEHKWELKFDDYGSSVEYLRVNDNTYLISKYDNPSPSTIKKYIDDLDGFVVGLVSIIESQDEEVRIDYELTINN